ncbi:MAG TPA: hypothetical protein VEV13_08080 [Candidatus Limnocylindria bacterium]|nr:hypothetical protein [Candidatus Limnocylindria bacterium]
MLGLPPRRAADFVGWGNAYLGGHVSLDTAAEGVVSLDPGHRVDGLVQGDDVSVTVALGRLAQAGARGLRLALPIPGDASSLPGPLDFNVEALAAGEAVLVVGAPAGLVPTVVHGGDSRGGLRAEVVRWRMLETTGALPGCSSVVEAGRALASAVREATSALTSLDLAATDPGSERGLSELRTGAGGPRGLPPGYSDRANEVVRRAWFLAALVALADGEDGAAVSAWEMSARGRQLLAVADAARAALVAGYNEATSLGSEGEPPGR